MHCSPLGEKRNWSNQRRLQHHGCAPEIITTTHFHRNTTQK